VEEIKEFFMKMSVSGELNSKRCAQTKYWMRANLKRLVMESMEKNDLVQAEINNMDKDLEDYFIKKSDCGGGVLTARSAADKIFDRFELRSR
jgi:putative protein kinase ArgK-like GTPase of G3E family